MLVNRGHSEVLAFSSEISEEKIKLWESEDETWFISFVVLKVVKYWRSFWSPSGCLQYSHLKIKPNQTCIMSFIFGLIRSCSTYPNSPPPKLVSRCTEECTEDWHSLIIRSRWWRVVIRVKHGTFEFICQIHGAIFAPDHDSWFILIPYLSNMIGSRRMEIPMSELSWYITIGSNLAWEPRCESSKAGSPFVWIGMEMSMTALWKSNF